MTRSAFVLGGTGLIGRALVPMLVGDGYEVTVGSRTSNPPTEAVRHVAVDRSRDEDFQAATSGDFDLFVDVTAYDQGHARQLLGLKGRVGSLVVISSAAVYADENGARLLGSESGSGLAIRESDPVVTPAPDGSDYSGGKVAVENTLLESDLPVTILRPGAIFGPGDRASREWHFAKRVLDGRQVVILSGNGEGVFHQVSSANVASMVMLATQGRGPRTVNCGDPEPRSIRDICDAVASAMNYEWEVVTFDGPSRGTLGETPWSVPQPFVMDLSVAREELGFTDAVPYGSAIAETCSWLNATTEQRPWEDALPAAAMHYGNLFDYEAEDEFLNRAPRQ